MSFDWGNLWAGFVFGVIGLWFVKRAKAEGNLLSLGVGIALLVYPYFIENAYLLWGLGVALVFLGSRG
jgi:hypothetical protein